MGGKSMTETQMEELNNGLVLTRDVLSIHNEEERTYTLYPTKFILEHLGYIKSFEQLKVKVRFIPYDIDVQTTVIVYGDVEVYEKESTDTHPDYIENSIELSLSDDEEVNEFDVLEDGNFDLLGVALGLLYDADFNIYSPYRNNDDNIFSEDENELENDNN